jgi:hypothetical protein
MKVFVSYSRDDEAAVRSLVDDLERARVQVWIDEELVGGDAWWTAILEQIRGCEVFLFALSDKSLDSKPCRAEWGYAQALGLPIVPVQIGQQVANRRADPIFSVQSVDYRDPTKNSAFDLISALHERARLRAELPDPLPEPPRIPYEYLQRLFASIHDTTAVLSPPVQAQMLFQLRSALSDEDDPNVLDDIRRLLRALRRRTDVTYTTAGEVDALLRSEPTMSGGAAEDESRADAVPSTTGEADAVPLPDRRHRRTILLAMAAVTIVVVALIAYLVVTRTSSPQSSSPQSSSPQSTVAAAYNCTQVSAPLTWIQPRSDAEPRLRIPQPPGWEQVNPAQTEKQLEKLPDEFRAMVRIVLRNESLGANVVPPGADPEPFYPTAVVTLQIVQGGGVNNAFEQGRKDLTSAGATDLSATDGTVCGRPAQTVTFTMPALFGVAAHPAKALMVADQAGNEMYIVVVTVQTTDPAILRYQQESKEILTGLQVLPPGTSG